MTILLGDNQYGKAETHVVRVTKSGALHEVRDLTVSVALAGDFAETHLTGDNSKVVPTDTQKNTVFAFAREPIGEIEEFGIRLARHFVGEFASVYRARVHIGEQAWERVSVRGKPHDHAFVRAGSDRRVAMVTCT
ncbi:MAG: urate oxidase, partial [Chloroflexi bacterium]